MSHFTTSENSQFNEVGERMNSILLEKAHCLQLIVGLSKDFWVESISIAAHIISRISCSAIDEKIPKKNGKVHL